METFQMRNSFHDASDKMMTLQWVCEKMSSICLETRCLHRELTRWEDVSISPFIDSSSLGPLETQSDKLKYHTPHSQEYNLHDFYSLCRGEQLDSVCSLDTNAICELRIQDPYFTLAPSKQVFKVLSESQTLLQSCNQSGSCLPRPSDSSLPRHPLSKGDQIHAK